MNNNTQQLEARHEVIVSSIVATMNQATTKSELEEDIPLYRSNLQKVIRIGFIATATSKDRYLKPIVNFVKKRDWYSLKLAYEDYLFDDRNRLHVKEDCLLLDERITIP